MDGFHTVAGGGSQRLPLARPRVKVISVARMTFRLIIHDDVVSLCAAVSRALAARDAVATGCAGA